ncbi:MAG: phage portal protein [Kiritimatiellia bacterium]
MIWPLNIFARRLERQPRRRAFQASQPDRTLSEWRAATASIDADIRAGMVRLRNRSRDLCQNNDYAKAARRTVVVNVVGQGIKMQATSKRARGGKPDKAANEAIEKAWKKWKQKENCDAAGMLSFAGIEQMIMSSVFESGEILIRKIRKPMGNMKIPLALDLIEADLLDESYNETNLPGGAYIKMGVEKNQWHRPIAYHFLANHPGDVNSGWQRTGARMRVPADEIHHLFCPERIKQTRGVPWLASTAIRLHHMKGYEDAEVISARATASLMGFIETPNGELQGDAVDPDTAERLTEFSPGVFKYLAEGEKIVVPDLKRPGGQFDPFMRSMLRGVATGLGQSYESVSGDYSQTNYSSSRLSLNNERDVWRVIQAWLIENFHQPLFVEWLDLAVLSGEIVIKDFYTNEENYLAPRWTARGWSWVDPAREVAAGISSIRAGLSTQTEIVAQGGGDFEELMVQRKRELELAKELGLVFDTDPAQVDGKGSSQALATAGAAKDDPPAGTKPKPGSEE